MRSGGLGDRPTGNTAATNESAADTEAARALEDIDVDRPATAVRPTGHEGADRPSPSGSSWPEPDDDSAWPRDRPWSADDSGPGTEPAGGPDLAGGPDAANGDGPAGGESLASAGAAGLAGEAGRAAGPGTAAPRSAGWTRAGALASRPGVAAMLAGVRRLRLPATGPRRRHDTGGTSFARITVLPAILVIAWLLPGIPLLLARAFVPLPMLLIAAPLAVALIAAGLRKVPPTWPRTLAGAGPEEASAGRDRSAWWGLGGTVAVAAGFVVWQFLFNSESVIVLRDPGAYVQTGYWIAQHGSLPIPQSLASFGGAHPGLGFSSIGFLSRGGSVVPGLMSGLPLLLAGAFWVHGISAAAAMGPIFGGLAVLSFGGLAGRLAGPRWAPAGALVLGLTLPEQYTSRGSFSETAVQVLLFGGLALVADALTLGDSRPAPAAPQASGDAPPGASATSAAPDVLSAGAFWNRWSPPEAWGRWITPQRATMALGGLALGLAAAVRFDGLLDVLPAIPFAGVLLVRRSAAVLAFCGGLVLGAGFGLADGYLLARPFVDGLAPAPMLIGLIAAWLAAMTLAGVELLRLPGLRDRLRKLPAARPLRWLPDLGGLLAVAALIGLAVRPYLQIVRERAGRASADYVAHLQRLGHLPVDPGRLYAEDTLYWVIWYVGIPTLLLGAFGVALLVRWCLRALLSWRDPSGAARIWALPLMVICCGSAAVLWQPETVPDQPWASRRLVPLVLPGLILCAIWASAWFCRRARSRGASRTAASVVAGFCVVALLVPTVATTFGLGLTHSGRDGSLRPSADGLALKRTGSGAAGAVSRLCASLGPSASVLILDRLVADQFSQVIRGMCGVPVASMIGQPPQAVQNVLVGIERVRRRPVLLGALPSEVSAYGGSPLRVLNLLTTQDPHTLTTPPTTPWPARYVIWMSAPGVTGARV